MFNNYCQAVYREATTPQIKQHALYVIWECIGKSFTFLLDSMYESTDHVCGLNIHSYLASWASVLC